MIAGRLPRPWQLSALARGSLLWVRGHPAVAPPPPLALPLTQQMWLDHHGEGPSTSGSDYGQTIQLYQLQSTLPSAATLTLPRGEV